MTPAPLRVAVDATPLLGTRTGVGNFTHALLQGLGGRDDVIVTAFAVSLRGRRDLEAALPPGVEVVTPPLPATILHGAWRRFGRPRIDTFIGDHDVIHGPNYVVPPSRAARVMTVHDLTPLRFPELCNPATLVYPDLIRRAARGGAWVHTDSDAVRTEAIDALGLDPRRVVSVPLGVTPMAGGDSDVGRRLAGVDRFVLAVGTVEPRKDLVSLARAVDRLAGSGHDVPVVHVGPDGWGSDALAQALAEMDRPDLFVRLGRVDDADLRHLYAAARLVAYPSVYEGFGLPVLEAMSAGTPVVSTGVAAITEVAGDAARLVPVGDVDALADAIWSVWVDEGVRQRMIALGADRARRYAWDRCVDGIVDLYQRMARDSE